MACGKDNNNVRKLNLCILFTNYIYIERNLDWIKVATAVNYTELRIEKNPGLFAFSVLLMLLKGLDKRICCFQRRKKEEMKRVRYC